LLREILYDQLTHYPNLYTMDAAQDEVATETEAETEDKV